MMLALFGFFMAVAYHAPWYVWLIGALCLVLDSGRRRKNGKH
jgi:hypothetical protein